MRRADDSSLEAGGERRTRSSTLAPAFSALARFRSRRDAGHPPAPGGALALAAAFEAGASEHVAWAQYWDAHADEVGAAQCAATERRAALDRLAHARAVLRVALVSNEQPHVK